MSAELSYNRPSRWMPAALDRLIYTPMQRLLDNSLFSAMDLSMQESADAYQLEIAVPGMKKKDLKMEVANRILSIQGQKKQKKGFAWPGSTMEYKKTQFYRTLTLPEDADVEQIKAKCKNGLLKISIPKIQSHRKVKQIPVTSVDEPTERRTWWQKLISPLRRLMPTKV